MITHLNGDCREILRTLPDNSVQCVVTSPPYYGLRDYGVDGQIGLEQTPDEYIAEMVAVFREVRRVLRDDGTLWLNIGDSYAASGAHSGAGSAKQKSNTGANSDTKRIFNYGCKQKDLLLIPAQVALALRADGWYLRSDIIWHKPNPMPESVKDRPTNAHEHVFLLTKSAKYFYDQDAVREPNSPAVQREAEKYANDPRVIAARKLGNIGAAPDRSDSAKTLRIGNNAFSNPKGRNMRNVWTISTKPYKGAHFATMPVDLAERCIKAGTKPNDVVLDPFGGAGTTGMAAEKLGRNSILIELNSEYVELSKQRA